MAKIYVLDQQKKRLGSVDFVFSRDPSERRDYLFVDIDANWAHKLHLRRSKVLDAEGRAIADLEVTSNGKDIFGHVVPIGRDYPYLGSIKGSKATLMTANGEIVLGRVSEKSVISDVKGIVGELDIDWGLEDEEFYQQDMQGGAKKLTQSSEGAQLLLERLRPVMYQNMMNLAGCAALIIRLFEEKKRGCFG